MKKLTAGIFTVMLGLCTTSGADAAVASQGYVDAKVGVNTQSITELTGDVTDLQTQVGEGTVDSRIETAKQAAIDAAAADATTKANKALEDAKADAEKYIDETELTTSQSAQNTAIETAYKAADKVITDSIGTVPADKTVVGMIAEAQTAATYDDTAVKADIAKNAGAIATLNGDDQTEGSVAKSIADAFTQANLSKYATTEAMNTALAAYELKSNLKALAYKGTVGTNDIDNLAVTTGKLANGAVTADKLGANAVTDDKISAVSSSKVTGLSDSLAEKLTIPTVENGKDGKFVLTATSANGQATYYWEEIAREVE